MGDTIPLIWFAVSATNSKKLVEAQAVEKIFAAVRADPAQLGIDPFNTFPGTILKNCREASEKHWLEPRLLKDMGLL